MGRWAWQESDSQTSLHHCWDEPQTGVILRACESFVTGGIAALPTRWEVPRSRQWKGLKQWPWTHQASLCLAIWGCFQAITSKSRLEERPMHASFCSLGTRSIILIYLLELSNPERPKGNGRGSRRKVGSMPVSFPQPPALCWPAGLNQ